jgi:EAL domain-containing protein (putative c-di-GMP-specific phosphodiesterase class I)
VALDDFGTGFATLAQLHQLPADALKVDRLFVDGIRTGDGGDAAIVRSVLALGRDLGLAVIAEGVETADQMALLRDFGCQEVQGFLYSQALAQPVFQRWLGVRLALTGAGQPRPDAALDHA